MEGDERFYRGGDAYAAGSICSLVGGSSVRFGLWLTSFNSLGRGYVIYAVYRLISSRRDGNLGILVILRGLD